MGDEGEAVDLTGTATPPGASGRVLWASSSLATRGGMTTFVRTMLDTPLSARWTIDRVETHCEGSAPARAATFARGALAFLRLLLGRRPDVVHLHTSRYGSVARKAALLWTARAARVPVVLHVHAGEFADFYDRMPRPIRWLIRRTLIAASTVVALGSHLARQLISIAPGARVVAIPNGIRVVGTVRRAGAGECVHVVFLGQIGAGKGTFTLLEAWAALATGTPAQLTIAGDGEVQRARDMAARLGLSGSVDVRSWLSPAEVADLLGSADVLTLPSRYEGQPMAVLEAMARGICVVASRVGGIPDLIENGISGLLVPPDDVPALAGALRHVLEDHEARRRIGDTALARARDEFDVDVLWRRFDALYRELQHRELQASPASPVRPAGTGE